MIVLLLLLQSAIIFNAIATKHKKKIYAYTYINLYSSKHNLHIITIIQKKALNKLGIVFRF